MDGEEWLSDEPKRRWVSTGSARVSMVTKILYSQHLPHSSMYSHQENHTAFILCFYDLTDNPIGGGISRRVSAIMPYRTRGRLRDSWLLRLPPWVLLLVVLVTVGFEAQFRLVLDPFLLGRAGLQRAQPLFAQAPHVPF